MSVNRLLGLFEAVATARTVPGLERALSAVLGARAEIVDGRVRTKSRAFRPEVLNRVAAVALEHVTVLARVAELNRQTTTDREKLHAELKRAVLPGSIVAASRELRRVFHELVPAVARTDTTVLVRGETGTGKEIVARQVHALSSRSHRPFLAVNCGALPDGLVESALFGHEPGAFTGADRRHAGVFERAHGGTLFLDEIGDLPLLAQVKLLRVLQEGEVERLGSDGAIPVDVRVIAATHRPLESMIEQRKFRPDLFYRLNVFPIDVPPLRARPADVDALVASTLQRLAARQRRLPPRVPAAALARLRRHSWPGNVRELENVLERAMLTSSDVLELPPGFEHEARALSGQVDTFAEASRRAIRAALTASEGRIYGARGAARSLGLKPSTLQSKMSRLGLNRRARR